MSKKYKINFQLSNGSVISSEFEIPGAITVTDDSLTVEDIPADARAVGDQIEALKQSIANISGSDPDAIKITVQELTEDQQMQARKNLELYRKEYVAKVLANLEIFARKTDISEVKDIFTSTTLNMECDGHDVEPSYQLERQSENSSSAAGVFYNVSWFGNGNLIRRDTDLYADVQYIEETKYTDVPFVLYEYYSDFKGGKVYRLYVDEDVIPNVAIGLGLFINIVDPENLDEVYHPVPTEYLPALIGATSDTDGASGLVPAPMAGDEGKFLSGDGTWKSPESSGGASSWNDLTDKPFGKEGEENYLVSPMDLQFVYGDAYPDEPITVDPADFTAGNILYVVWNGTIYETTVQYHNMAMYNYIGGTANDGTSIPFSIMDIDGNGTLTISDYTNNPTGTISFALAKSLAVIKTLDPVYLPIDKEISEEGNGLLKNSTVAKAKKELEERIASVEEKVHEPLGSIETIEDRMYTSLYNYSPVNFVSEKQYTVDEIVGSELFGDSAENGEISIIVTADMIVEYEWGFAIEKGNNYYGVMVNDAGITYNGHTYEKSGLYLGAYYDYLTDSFSMRCASYGLQIVKAIDSRLMPRSLPGVLKAEVGQTIKVSSIDENGKPTGWEVAELHESFKLIGSLNEAGIISDKILGDLRKYQEVVIILRINDWTARGLNSYSNRYAGSVCFYGKSTVTENVHVIGIPVEAGTYTSVERIIRVNMSCDKAFYTETLIINGGEPTTVVGVSSERLSGVIEVKHVEVYNVGDCSSIEFEVYGR